MRCFRFFAAVLLNIPLFSILLLPAPASAQTGARVAFGVNPTVFRAGQGAHAVLSVSNVSVTPLSVSAGDSFTFFFDSAIGSLLNGTTIKVSSSSLSAGDFSFLLSASQVTINYNGQTKAFAYGDSISMEVSFLANSQIGSGKISLSCRFVSAVNGNLPYTTVSIVDFANGGVSAVAHDSTLTGDGTTGSPLGVVPSSVTVAHGGTLTGNGTSGSPLEVAMPLTLNGSVPSPGFGMLFVNNFADGSDALTAFAGTSDVSVGGHGVVAAGGDSNSGTGGVGVSASGGDSDSGSGGRGVTAHGGDGNGSGNSGGIGIEAFAGFGGNGANRGLAGKFNGDVQVTGNISKGGGSFKIDHPLDPENKYLYHSFVESPDMKNIYDGNVVTDENGDATVTLPGWFEALNRDFRYQLTVIGQFAQAIIAAKIKDNRFTIRTSSPGVEVSWQVTGIRRDAWANKNRIPVEQEKSDRERGYYLHPGAFNQPEERGIEWARDPELMRRLKERSGQRKQEQAGVQLQQR